LKVSAAPVGGGDSINGTGNISVTSVGGVLEITSANFNFDNSLTGSLIQDPTPGIVYYYDFAPSNEGLVPTKPADTENYIYFDNILASTTTGSALFDGNGIILQLSDGGVLNFFFDAGNAYYVEYGNGAWVTQPGDKSQIQQPASMSITPIPEPNSLSLLGTGLLALAGFVIWRAKTGLVRSA